MENEKRFLPDFLTRDDMFILEEIKSLLEHEVYELLDQWYESQGKEPPDEEYDIKYFKFIDDNTKCYIEFNDGSNMLLPIELRNEESKQEIEVLWYDTYWDGPISGFCFYNDDIHYFKLAKENTLLKDRNLLFLDQVLYKLRYYDIYQIPELPLLYAIAKREHKRIYPSSMFNDKFSRKAVKKYIEIAGKLANNSYIIYDVENPDNLNKFSTFLDILGNTNTVLSPPVTKCSLVDLKKIT